ncbi:DUF1033 family protein [Streptococcus chenjunshii]|uniref:DUF1033 family protein n=1 Tax=Streptococcus chenjunshii TaxID=2173853 RepID=A0A372KL40_9STRE|nr:DUF1033 family protein [Streptococcus chenjunshii]AXQ79678.1 DUF1033 family protein [Streptococcus chenjunshii]RFU50865.1 DUF1033 family protein [Streptococcus chenjunshii]RFU53011.1 DUF1033 family protein [Streptococcus chenjunshii]
MYQVVKMEADFEPWWFFEEWQQNVTESVNFTRFDDALICFEKEWGKLRQQLPSYQSRQNLLAAFWNNEEQYWCEECDDYLQNYHSLLLLEDWETVSQHYYMPSFEQRNDFILPYSCSLRT